jgi:hypothetical protein
MRSLGASKGAITFLFMQNRAAGSVCRNLGYLGIWACRVAGRGSFGGDGGAAEVC